MFRLTPANLVSFTQLLSLSTTRNDSGTYFTALLRWDSPGPIVDFVVLDPEKQVCTDAVNVNGGDWWAHFTYAL